MPSLTFPIVLLIAGAVLILVAASNKFTSKEVDVSIRDGARRLCGILGGVFVVAAIYLYAVELRQRSVVPPPSSAMPADPATLISIIQRKQAEHVRTSSGQTAETAFTDDDLKRFRDAHVPERVALELRADPHFRSAVRAIAALTPVERDDLLATAATTARPTFAALGTISTAGQTDAGHEADLLIARAAADLARQIVERKIP